MDQDHYHLEFFLNIHFVEISVGNDVIKVVVDYGGQIYDKNNYQTEQT